MAHTNLGDVVKGEHPLADLINKVYKKFIGPRIGTGDRDLYDVLLTPIAGDFNRIRANGEAWGVAAQMYWATEHNLLANSVTLVGRDWHGAAADAFIGLTKAVWAGALYVAKSCCEWMQKGFIKLADLAIKIATRCVQLLEKIFDLLAKLGKKLVPVAGQLKSIWDLLTDGEIPYVDEIGDLIDLVEEVLGLYSSLEELVKGINGYLDQIGAIADAVGKVPSIGSMNDAAEVGRQLQESKKKMDENRKKIDEASQQIDGKLAGLDKHAQ
ncbi:hypothetical protein [Amycolatopsis sp. CA-230715]|uniref:hypothetical protein n=1 Tax=Amycolatopsis sp. CA-230715 TaxID=2745196 RepID=UPI001C00AFF1|nr:hypothetical protein [Amycolatopsis sp. CA-230715]QWF78871.1 hypothetical protein HUW46_02269 [Amycolatopsis sp. CA-230715]